MNTNNENVGWKDGLPYIKTHRQKTEEETLKHLKGKRVIDVRYMKNTELGGWSQAPLIIIFEDGTYIYAQSDNEANNAGCLSGGNFENPNLEIYCPTDYPTKEEKK